MAESTPRPSDWNQQIITEFRANAGKVGGMFQGAPMLILHHTGAKSGQVRENPLMYQDLGNGCVAIFASKGGAPTSPDWYHNLRAHPHVQAEVGTETHTYTAYVAEGAERDRIWAAQKQAYPQFAEYERKTNRQIPVVILEPAS